MYSAIDTKEKYNISYIDASGLSTFNRCPAKYLFERLIGLAPIGKTDIAPDFGTCMHRALPLAYNDLEGAIKEFCDAWSSYDYGSTDEKRNAYRAMMMLRNFHAERSPAKCPYEILQFPDIVEATQEKISQYEIPFAIDIGAAVPACGRIDLPIKWKSTEHIFACDYKTTQEISPRFFKCFANSAQAILYTIALNRLTGKDVKGMVIEAIRVSKTNTETQAGFLFINNVQIEWFLDYARNAVESMLYYNKEKCWPKNLCACSGYSMYGHPTSTCEFMNICTNTNWEATSRMFEKREVFHPFNIEEIIE